ncbi:MAG: hypothetical protein JXR48_06055 [Candidatus Delongbacteria bacterium]|nr:hypothetical protein [Candidatus Delongbacteria bacterium]MBN2834514.1 hypothetical protein [Candidatus Delongbacteria bacterium]
MSDKFLMELTKVGLTEHEARTYLILLKKDSISASEIAQLTKINRSNVYGVLGGLVLKGLCEELPGKVRKFRALNPANSFENLKTDYLHKISKINDLADILTLEYESNEKAINPLDFITVLTSRSSIMDKIMKFHHTAEEEVKVFSKQPFAFSIESNMEKMTELVKAGTKRGVKYRVIYEVEGNEDREELLKSIKTFEKMGEIVRVLPKLPMKLMIFDDKVTIFSLKNSSELSKDFTSMIIEHRDHALGLSEMFEAYWEKGITIDEYYRS